MSGYGNDFARKGVDKQQYQDSGLADTKSFGEFQTDRRAEARSKIENAKKGGEYYKTSGDGTKYLARDPNVDKAEWDKNYFSALGIKNDGHERGDGNPGSWGEEAHNEAVRAANQGITITQEDRRIGYGNEADFDAGESVPGPSDNNAPKVDPAEEEKKRAEAKARSQEFQAKASTLRNQFSEGRKSYQNNTFTDAQNVNNSTNSARSAMPEKFDVRAASRYSKVKRWDAENSNPSSSNI